MAHHHLSLIKCLIKHLNGYSGDSFQRNKWIFSCFKMRQDGSNIKFKGTFRYGHNGCPCCPHVLKGDTVQATVTNKQSNITTFVNCNTRYQVYIVTCQLCHIQYFGVLHADCVIACTIICMTSRKAITLM